MKCYLGHGQSHAPDPESWDKANNTGKTQEMRIWGLVNSLRKSMCGEEGSHVTAPRYCFWTDGCWRGNCYRERQGGGLDGESRERQVGTTLHHSPDTKSGLADDTEPRVLTGVLEGLEL